MLSPITLSHLSLVSYSYIFKLNSDMFAYLSFENGFGAISPTGCFVFVAVLESKMKLAFHEENA